MNMASSTTSTYNVANSELRGSLMRPSERTPNQIRPVTFTRNYTMHAEGSVLVEFGNTKVLCTATVEAGVPRFMKGQGKGWVTAEYGMLPRSTNTRMEREASRGKQSGRTSEIQRLIGRSLRSVVDLVELGEKQIKIDSPNIDTLNFPLPVMFYFEEHVINFMDNLNVGEKIKNFVQLTSSPKDYRILSLDRYYKHKFFEYSYVPWFHWNPDGPNYIPGGNRNMIATTIKDWGTKIENFS